MKKIDIDLDDASYVIDSSGWIEYFAGGKYSDEFGKYIEKANPGNCYTPTIVVYEVYKKIYRDIGEEEALKAVAYIKYSTNMVDITEDIAISSAEYSIQEKLPMADALIYTVSRKCNSILVTGDGHFKGKDSVVYFGR